jgi:dUTP pyrophosphatase
MELLFKKLNVDAKSPSYATSGSAGFDLSSTENLTLNAGGKAIVGTGLAFDIPEGYELQIRPRSGLAAKFGITVLNSPGTIDSDYVDEVKIILQNTGASEFIIKKGDRIAQAVFSPVVQAALKEAEEIDLTKDRGGGFGSTGV